MVKTLESPMISYLVIGFFSLLAAGIMFLIGGSFAQVANQQGNFLGFTFQAGGAFAGFILVFWLSLKTVERLRLGTPSEEALVVRVPVNDKLPLSEHPSCFARSQSYTCTYVLFDVQSGDRRESPVGYTWEAGHLTVYVPGAGKGDRIQVRVNNGQVLWESEHIDWRTQATIVKLVS